MDAGLDTLATALYARGDDLLKACPERAPWRPATGICPQISDAELVTLAVMSALLGFVSEARWLRLPAGRCGACFRHRLNRGGDRQANHALWRIILTRMSSHLPTRAFVTRRSREGLPNPRSSAASLGDYRSRGPDGRAVVPRSCQGMASLPSRRDGQF